MSPRDYFALMKRLIVLTAAVLVACTTQTRNIAPEPFPVSTFEPYGCDKLAEISHNLKVRSEDLREWLQKSRSLSARQQKQDYARLRGQYFAVQEAQIVKDWPARVETAQPAAPGVYAIRYDDSESS